VVDRVAPEVAVEDVLFFQDLDALFVESGVFAKPVDVVYIKANLCTLNVLCFHEVQNVRNGPCSHNIIEIIFINFGLDSLDC